MIFDYTLRVCCLSKDRLGILFRIYEIMGWRVRIRGLTCLPRLCRIQVSRNGLCWLNDTLLPAHNLTLSFLHFDLLLSCAFRKSYSSCIRILYDSMLLTCKTLGFILAIRSHLLRFHI